MPVLALGDQAEVRRGEPVAVMGSPVGLIGSITTGVASYVGRTVSYYMPDGRLVTIPDMVQTSAAVNPGNSGGAMINLRGELIGVPSVKLAGLAYEGLAFAIGVRTVREVLAAAGIQLAPKPEMYRPDYESLGWHITAAEHTRAGPVRYLVLHHEGSKTASGSNALAIHRWYLTRTDGDYAATGYHGLFERDGRIAEGRPLWAVGAHAARKGGPDYNPESIAGCLVGNMSLGPPTDEEWQSAVAWFRWLRVLWPDAGIRGHRELPGLSTDCPGSSVNMDAFRRAVEGR